MKKCRKGTAFSQLSRELSEEDLNAPGTKKMILNMLDSLNLENESLKFVQKRFYDVDKQYAVLNEKYKSIKCSYKLRNIFAMLGSLLLGGIPWLIDHQKTGWWIVLDVIIAAMLILLPYYISAKSDDMSMKDM